MPEIKFPALINEGDITTTRHKQSPFWVTNIIYKVKSDGFFTSLAPGYVNNSIMPGDPFQCKFGRENFEYIIEGSVENIFTDKNGYIEVRVSKCERIESMRKHRRHVVHVCANVSSVLDNVPHFAIIHNISYGGASFISNYFFEQGEEVQLNVYIDDSTVLNPTGTIVQSVKRDTSTEYGIMFASISDSDREALECCVRDKVLEEQKLIRFFEEKIKGRI